MNRPSDSNSDRRGFFRAAARELLHSFVSDNESTPPAPVQVRLLRPPGAIDETRFVDMCQRCGKCVEVCPALAIKPFASPNRALDGTPFIDPNTAACVICDGLKCTHVCPSGALNPLNLAVLINMGVAEVREELCVRSSGESCTICVDRCPVGKTAIRFDNAGPPTVFDPGCVGCGVCQFYCPTTPKAIVVKPC